MTYQNRLSAFVKLGHFLREQLQTPNAEFSAVITQANCENAWFTDDNISFALQAVADDLNAENLSEWLAHYPFLHNQTLSKTVAVIMAGNLPLVGFRDFLSVLVAGHKIICKLSSKDTVLLRYLSQKLIDIESEFLHYIHFEDRIIKGFDAIIATGGRQAVAHFHEYFSKYPHLIRGHRTSCAILDGSETTDELHGLFEDMFRYFGLGCRNVTKLWVPKEYDFQPLTDVSQSQTELQESLKQHHLYQSNYQYQQVVSALNAQKSINTDLFTLMENSASTPPISVVYYDYYSDLADVRRILEMQKEQLQCIVSHSDIPFGIAQKTKLMDYADGIDTMLFLGKF
ncbi:MAG: hypothetical protein LBU91_07100 [Bacteroidales bacterium]|jgi:hypothetical protein|nr:hypothetical protein [Bacteroidales bacterium]